MTSAAPEPEPDPDGWPPLPRAMDEGEATKALFEARIAYHQARLHHGMTKVEAAYAADLANAQTFYSSLLKLSDGSLERAQAGADAVQKAAAAVATIYAGVLSISFSVSSRALPWRGVLAPIFLCLAIALSTAYRAHITRQSRESPAPEYSEQFATAALRRANTFSTIVRGLVVGKASLLRAGVAALSVGILYLPVAFVSFPGSESPAVAADSPRWPVPPDSAMSKEYGAILYKAQVDEAANLHSPTEGDENVWWPVGLLLGGLLVVYAGGRPWRAKAGKGQGRGQGQG
ncbi:MULTISPECIES: hypothetical protein [unclassified Streptomyces]|uniref:hypothetical protein n=1 Tax=unclassified Streptomyces TaxID=2593676 RepID=UPI001BEA13B8|nr:MULTISPECIES: hypothetical protein [unclassified Streptomyces]MBT2403624.1 hypothetical protein [Streptomyces sp. ISL-21]MBT2459769.1 hypothetical protein [Streptomyces sp. ISL-86]MBT2609837.1 hypothetical protein [Streptomyces sp. ISL-87]